MSTDTDTITIEIVRAPSHGWDCTVITDGPESVLYFDGYLLNELHDQLADLFDDDDHG